MPITQPLAAAGGAIIRMVARSIPVCGLQNSSVIIDEIASSFVISFVITSHRPSSPVIFLITLHDVDHNKDMNSNNKNSNNNNNNSNNDGTKELPLLHQSEEKKQDKNSIDKINDKLETSTAGVHKMRLLHRHSSYHCLWCHLMTFCLQNWSYSLFENNTGQTEGRTDLRTDGHDLL